MRRWRSLARHAAAMLLGLLPAACASRVPIAACSLCMPAAHGVWVLDQGWHTEIGIPAGDITGALSIYRDIFPGAAVLMFSFGKRTWMTAKVDDLSELLMGPFPGPGVIEAIGLRGSPDAAFGGATVLRLALTAVQERQLSDFVWRAIGKTRAGEPRLLSQGRMRGSLFYASSHGYALDYTCNRWTAEALRAAGLPVDPALVVFPGGVMRQAVSLGKP